MTDMTNKVEGMRNFETGATRNLCDDKLAYEGFNSPLVMKRFAEYMHLHRKQADGSMRSADNWQKGIPLPAYLDSAWRHFMDVFLHLKGYEVETTEDLETALCGLIFNINGILHETLKEELADGGPAIDVLMKGNP